LVSSRRLEHRQHGHGTLVPNVIYPWLNWATKETAIHDQPFVYSSENAIHQGIHQELAAIKVIYLVHNSLCLHDPHSKIDGKGFSQFYNTKCVNIHHVGSFMKILHKIVITTGRQGFHDKLGASSFENRRLLWYVKKISVLLAISQRYYLLIRT